MNYSKERAWIDRKLSSGVSKEQLLHGVGSFSNKKKQRVMQEKGLSEKQYQERYDFLANVYYLLSGGK